jgi:hypothetical protein
LFIGWRAETGLALFNLMLSSATRYFPLIFNTAIPCPAQGILFSCFGALPKGRPTGMLSYQLVRWTIVPASSPQPWIACSRCGVPRPFKSSGKFRMNANGKRLDAWLIYRCTRCAATWNRPLLQRQNVDSIDRDVLSALQSNDASLALQHAFDLGALRQFSHHVEECHDVTVTKFALSPHEAEQAGMQIILSVPVATSFRLDRLLARELDISRAQLPRLCAAGLLIIDSGGNRPLRNAVKNGCRIHITGAALK